MVVKSQLSGCTKILNPCVSGAILALNIGANEMDIEHQVGRFFHNTLDRMGGRDARRKRAHDKASSTPEREN